MTAQYPRGKIMGSEDLALALVDGNDNPTDAYEISYAIYQVTSFGEVPVGTTVRKPVHPELGMYYASFQIPENADLGKYRIRWTFQQSTTSPQNTVMEEFRIVEPETYQTSLWTPIQADMIRRLRILLRDNCIGEEEIVEVDVGDGELMEVTMKELWEVLHDPSSRIADTSKEEKLKKAYSKKALRVRSLSPEGKVEWKPIIAVHKADTSNEDIVEVSTPEGPMVLTGGHRVYTSPTSKVDADQLTKGSVVRGGMNTFSYLQTVSSVKQLPSRKHMYDVEVEDNHNLLLMRSGTFVSNCPDRNYHFRPPTSEGTMSEKNRVFSFIWTDEELIEYMERGVDFINLWPPETHWNSVDYMVKAKPAWRQMILMAAIAHATMALALNWISEEFSLVGEEEVTVYLPSGKEVSLPIGELYEICKEED